VIGPRCEEEQEMGTQAYGKTTDVVAVVVVVDVVVVEEEHIAVPEKRSTTDVDRVR
jgi:hypothetical protein